jgi:hypothetical protein
MIELSIALFSLVLVLGSSAVAWFIVVRRGDPDR